MAQWLGRRTLNLEAPGSSPTLATQICFTVAPFSNRRPRFVNRPTGLPLTSSICIFILLI